MAVSRSLASIDAIYDYVLPPKYELFRSALREFLRTEIADTVEYYDKSEEFPDPNVKKFAEHGYMGIPIPSEYGGAELGEFGYGLMTQEVGKLCSAHGTILGAHTGLCAVPIWLFGSEDQRKSYLPDLTSGKKLGAFGLTEPGAGSDAAKITTTATKSGDHFLLNGTKQFISNGNRADTMVVFAANDVSLGAYGGITAFIVERSFGGLRTSKVEKKMGIRASSTAQIVFEDCPVPKENILGTFGAGFLVALTTLDGGRASLSAGAVGGCEMALEMMVEHAREHPDVGSKESVQWMIADTAIDAHAARLTSYETLDQVGKYFELLAKGEKIRRREREAISRHTAIAKAFCSEAATRSLERAMQVLGSEGYEEGQGLERGYRDSVIAEIYEGTNDIQRLVIARDLLGYS
ncbi:MAG: acyl-CoA dehydrogenase family protein [Thaumarchaeota archaeon]|nr:acyl-CoA dehydrogenase family protein [Nitrososphaerota archaeon]MDG6906983.1 acyl-CoA dehydrogenase family protein [Nitrososphaerota archaeon]